MSFGRPGRREGKCQWEAHDRQQNKGRQPCAIMKDGSIVKITSLAHQVELAQGGSVRRFTFIDKVA